MLVYRDELDALNGIYSEQKRTNEILEQLLERLNEPEFNQNRTNDLLEQLLNQLNKQESNNRGDNHADTKHENA